MQKRLDPQHLLRNGRCPHDARKCSFSEKEGKAKPCGFDWCARQGGTNAHDRIDALEDKINALAAALSPTMIETMPAPPELDE